MGKFNLGVRLTSALCVGLVASAALLPGGAALAADPLFSPRALERAMLDLYCQFPGQDPDSCPQTPSTPQNRVNPAHPDAPTTPGAPPTPGSSPGQPGTPPAPPRLSAADKAVWALEIFDQTSQLDTDGFNDVMTHMAADYRQHPEHRPAIELVLSSLAVENSADVTGSQDHTADAVREKLREELADIRGRNTVITVMDDVLLAFTVAYAFEFGRGLISGGRTLWESGGEGITRLKKFQNVGKLVIESDKFAKNVVGKHKLMVFAAGVGMGLAEAAVQAFETFKIDPHHLLEPVQGDIVHTDAVRAAAERDELRAMMLESPEDLRSHLQAYRDRMPEIDKDVGTIQSEMEHLYTAAAQLRPQMDPIAQDLTETRQKITLLGAKLDDLDTGGGLR